MATPQANEMNLSLEDLMAAIGIIPKWFQIFATVKNKPKEWFRREPMDARDRALLKATRVNWMDYGKGSYLRKIVSEPWRQHLPSWHSANRHAPTDLPSSTTRTRTRSPLLAVDAGRYVLKFCSRKMSLESPLTARLASPDRLDRRE